MSQIVYCVGDKFQILNMNDMSSFLREISKHVRFSTNTNNLLALNNKIT